MKISGKELAKTLKEELKKEVEKLSEKGIIPQLAIITLGDEGAWAAYVKQKLKVAESLGILATHYNLKNTDQDELLRLINKLNTNPLTHGIIVQRPLPMYIDKQTIVSAIDKNKDVDGFRDDSQFEVPVFMAVEQILEEAAWQENKSIQNFLQNKNVVVIGKGETAGMPSIKGLEKKYNIKPIVIDSKTLDKEAILKNADIILSAAGKEVINNDTLKSGVVLVGIGTRVEEGKIKGDYDEAKIQETASLYTPTPGGIGPLNLTFLFKNLLRAAQKQTYQ